MQTSAVIDPPRHAGGGAFVIVPEPKRTAIPIYEDGWRRGIGHSHFFTGGRSLCGHFRLAGIPDPNRFPIIPAGHEDAAACVVCDFLLALRTGNPPTSIINGRNGGHHVG